MAINPANIQFYQCLTWPQGDSQGGDINTGVEIISGIDQSIFPDITDSDRIAGLTDYKKIYIQQRNVGETWNNVKSWFNSLPDNTTMSIALGTDSDIESQVKTGGTAPLSYVTPTSKAHGDVLLVGNLATDAYQSFWIKRVVAPGAGGETNDSFNLKNESS